ALGNFGGSSRVMLGMNWLADVLFILLWLGALVATFVPIIPATLVIWGAALAHALLTGFVPLNWGYLLGLGVLAVAAMIVDNLAAAWGAKKFGGSSYAAWGALFGGLLGLFLGPIGFLCAPFLGAMVFELALGKKPPFEAVKSGVGTLLGILGGAGAKLLIHIGMGALVLFRILSV
ncbi:MAG: DUF456 domain-containing protein, partial [Deinococcales bacterium]